MPGVGVLLLAATLSATPPTVAPDGQGWEALYRWCRTQVMNRHRLNDVKTGRSQLPELTALRHITVCFETGGRVR